MKPTSQTIRFLILCSCILSNFEALRSESPSSEAQAKSSKTYQDAYDSSLEVLSSKLKNDKGVPVEIALFSPIDYTQRNLGKIVSKMMQQTLERYGVTHVRTKEYFLPRLTLEDFRLAAIRNKSTLVVLVLLKATRFEMFIYDKRYPYGVVSYSQEVPDPAQYEFNPELVSYATELMTRQSLYLYVHDQFQELPRMPFQPHPSFQTLLEDGVPQPLINTDIFRRINKDLTSTFYAAAGLGAALTMGKNRQTWNSSVLSFQAGLKVISDLYVEGSVDAFSYTTVTASLKYLFQSKTSLVRLSLGIGYAYLTAHNTLNWDPSDSFGWNSHYFVPSAALLFPIGDVHLKAEAKVFLDVIRQRYIGTITPGLLVMF